MKVSIPRSIGAAEVKLQELGELATATEWHRAAIIATYVEAGEGQGRRPTSGRTARGGGLESATAFAARGIHGLKSHHTVLIYATAWLERFERPEPGTRVTIPNDPWPPTRQGSDGYDSTEGARRTLARIVERHGRKAVAGLVADDPGLTDAVDRERLDRVITPQQREELATGSARDFSTLERQIAEANAGIAEHVDHQAQLHVGTARMHLRLALEAMRREPYMADHQREAMKADLSEIDVIAAMLRQGGESWSKADVKFLEELGIGGQS